MLQVLSRNVLFILMFSLFPSFIFAAPPNVSLLKKEIRQYHDSGQYAKDLTNEIIKAQEFVLQQVEHYKTQKTNKKLALVLDIDETSLTNYTKIAQRDFSTDLDQIHKEILAADAPAIMPMLHLYQTALHNNVDVFFVTGRTKSELEATKKNLTDAGYTNWAGLYVRPNKYSHHSIISFKSEARKKIEDKGYIVLASIGDQYSDIKGGYALKGFKLPNPYYYVP